MPANDREVFAYLTSDPTTSVVNDHLTYAIFANEKQEWTKLFEQRHGRQPTQTQIDEWISNLTEWRFSQMREEAIQFFDNAARRYLAEEIAEEKDEVLRSALIREVRAAGSFWKQLAIALVTAILTPVIIGAAIAAYLTYDRILTRSRGASRRQARRNRDKRRPLRSEASRNTDQALSLDPAATAHANPSRRC